MLARLVLPLALSAPVCAQCLRGVTLPTGPDTTDARLGISLDVDGGVLLAGSIWDSEFAPNGGAAYLIDADTGQVLHKLKPDDPTEGKHFGGRVAIDGNHAVVTALGHYSLPKNSYGAVYVFNVQTGALMQKLLPAPNTENFGTSVDIDGGVVFVGTGDERAVIWHLGGGPTYPVTPSNPNPGDGFGWYGAIEGDRVVIGATGADRVSANSGTAYVFDLTGVELGEILTDGHVDSKFGSFPSMDQGRVSISAEDGVRVFDVATGAMLAHHSTTWQQLPSALHGDSLAIGYYFDWGGYEHGSGMVRVIDAITGQEEAWLGDQFAGHGDSFGFGLALDDDGVYVGAHFNDANASNSGKVNLFERCGEVGQGYCGPAAPNSTGVPGVLQAFGSATVSEDLLMLRASELPEDEFGYFLTSQTQAFIIGPGGSAGNLCLGGTIARFASEVRNSQDFGRFKLDVDLSAIPTWPSHAVQPGETWNFQAWFRDGTTSNFTDAVSITFL